MRNRWLIALGIAAAIAAVALTFRSNATAGAWSIDDLIQLHALDGELSDTAVPYPSAHTAADADWTACMKTEDLKDSIDDELFWTTYVQPLPLHVQKYRALALDLYRRRTTRLLGDTRHYQAGQTDFVWTPPTGEEQRLYSQMTAVLKNASHQLGTDFSTVAKNSSGHSSWSWSSSAPDACRGYLELSNNGPEP